MTYYAVLADFNLAVWYTGFHTGFFGGGGGKKFVGQCVWACVSMQHTRVSVRAS